MESFLLREQFRRCDEQDRSVRYEQQESIRPLDIPISVRSLHMASQSMRVGLILVAIRK